MRWILASLLLLLSLSITAANARIILAWVTQKKRSSMIPIVGGLTGAMGLLLMPVSGFAKWWWIPLIVDFGSLPLLVAATFFRLRTAGSKE